MGSRRYKKLICNMEESSLTSIPFHREIDDIKRWVAKSFPMHLAVHRIHDAKDVPHYTESHQHQAPEINMILGDDNKLTYKIQLGSEIYIVKSPASIWIPSGLEHSANVVEGSGYYICLILKDEYHAFNGKNG